MTLAELRKLLKGCDPEAHVCFTLDGKVYDIYALTEQNKVENRSIKNKTLILSTKETKK